MHLEQLTKPQRVAAACMLVVALAAFLPWVSIFGIGVVGIKGDGQITLVCAVVGLGLVALGSRHADQKQGRAIRIPAYVAAGIAALVGFGDMNGAAAIGLYLTLFGSVAWIGALVWDGMERKKAAAALAAPTPPHAPGEQPN